MVVLIVKRLPREENSKDYDEFQMTVPGSANVGDVTDMATRLQNMRVRLKWMIVAAKELAKEVEPSSRCAMDGAWGEAERYLALERTTVSKLDSTVAEVSALCDTIKGAAMICFPQQCSGADACARLAALLDNEDTDEKSRSVAHRLLSLLDEEATTPDIVKGPTVMWWSGKPLTRDSDFIKHAGKNEKTKLMVKISPEGGSAPPREPGLDHRTQQEMMAYWYRKQEEQKKLVEDEDISYGNSEWANPRGLKSQLSGVANVQFKPS